MRFQEGWGTSTGTARLLWVTPRGQALGGAGSSQLKRRRVTINWEKQYPTCVLECQTGHTLLQAQSCGTLGPESWPLTSPHWFCQPLGGQRSTGWAPSGCSSAALRPGTPAPSSSAFPWHNGHYPEERELLECPDGLPNDPTETSWAHGAFKWKDFFQGCWESNVFFF